MPIFFYYKECSYANIVMEKHMCEMKLVELKPQFGGFLDFFSFFLPPTCRLFFLCICFKCAFHCYDLGSTKLKCPPFVLSDTRDTWWVLSRYHVSEISGFCGDSRKDCGNQRVGSGSFISSFKDRVARFCSRREWIYFKKKPGSESTKETQSLPTYLPAQEAPSTRLQEMSGVDVQVLLKPAGWRELSAIWSETVVTPGSAAVTRPLSLAPTFHGSTQRTRTGLQRWWRSYGLDGEVRSQW